MHAEHIVSKHVCGILSAVWHLFFFCSILALLSVGPVSVSATRGLSRTPGGAIKKSKKINEEKYPQVRRYSVDRRLNWQFGGESVLYISRLLI